MSNYDKLRNIAREVRIVIRRNPTKNYTSTSSSVVVEGWMLGKDWDRSGADDPQYFGDDYEEFWIDFFYILDTSSEVWCLAESHTKLGGRSHKTPEITSTSTLTKVDSNAVVRLTDKEFRSLIEILTRLS